MKNLATWRSIVTLSLIFWILGIGFFSIPADAEEVARVLSNISQSGGGESAGPAHSTAFGQQSQDFWVSAFQFAPLSGGQWNHQQFGYFRNSGGFSSSWGAQVELPAGALVTGLECHFFDEVFILVATVGFWKEFHDISTNTPGSTFITSVSTTGNGGFEQPSSTGFNAPILFREGNRTNTYMLRLDLPFTSDLLGVISFKGCRLFWQRQISPAPAVATFVDVPLGHPFFQFIEALAASGITIGCAVGQYCPDQPVTRAQMAAFLARALGLHFPF
jgi:hypothetical protein